MTNDPLFSVADHSVVLAGAAGGLGQAIAHAFAERGAKIVAADVDLERAETLTGSLSGDGHSAHRLDVSDEASCRETLASARDAFGRVDVVINATGIFSVAPALELEARAFDETLRVNLSGAFLLARAAASTMIADGGGSIITIASVSSHVANPGYAAYASSKAGLAQLVRVLAREWAEFHVTVNAIGPAMILTPMTEQYLKSTDNYDYALAQIPMRRFGIPEDIVGTALLLASRAGAFITGQTIFVDGGRTCV